jgi:hypothetical protein
MKSLKRAVGFVLFVAGLCACGASTDAGPGLHRNGETQQCRLGGARCRWDDQCCSSRCYVDTGCMG